MPDPTETTQYREVAAGVLGNYTSFRLFVRGSYGSTQIETIIRHLEVSRDTLAATDEPANPE